MSTRTLWPGLLFVVALAVAAACSVIVDPAGTPPFCSSDDTDCGEGYVCAEVDGERRCVEDGSQMRCSDDDECAAAGTDNRFCVNERCVECRESSDCLLGEVDERGLYCSNNECHEGCDDDGCCCPEESRCIDRICRPPQDEECNGRDDDFDDRTDEDFDSDEDGVSSCARVDPIPDCDDGNEDMYPGNPERCDGLDNDCDGDIDDGDDLCEAGQVCDQLLGDCVTSDDCEFDHECPPDHYCADDGQCYPRTVEFGGPCTDDSECGVYQCISTASFSSELSGRRCTKACCNEGDCPPASFCAVTESGLRLCAPNTWFDSIGVGCGGDTCPACWQRRCRSQCCGASDCGGGECLLAHETITPAGELATTLCDVRTGGIGLYGESECGAIGSMWFSFCRAGYQWVVEEALGVPVRCVCSAPCCSHADCTDGGDEPGARCIVSSAGFSMCYPPSIFGALGSGEFGDYCGSWDACDSGACHPDGYCSETCCPGSDCPDASVCRPAQGAGGAYTAMCTLP